MYHVFWTQLLLYNHNVVCLWYLSWWNEQISIYIPLKMQNLQYESGKAIHLYVHILLYHLVVPHVNTQTQGHIYVSPLNGGDI